MTHMTKMLMSTVLVAGLALLMTACAACADDAADKAAIHQLWDEYEANVVAGDGETWIGLYDREGIQMRPGMPMRSYEEVAEAVKAWTPDDVDAMSISPMETVILGDMAYSMGTYTVDFTTDDGPGQVDGKFMTLLRRQDDGSWGIYRDIFNSNKRSLGGAAGVAAPRHRHNPLTRNRMLDPLRVW